ncbi:MAG TPA: hypothetical protein VJL34_07940 [Anaerolineales bacterium]|nr:hypothetical protein [Anaerolineales bacterium]
MDQRANLPGPKHWMCAPLEVDVTVPCKQIVAHKALTGETLSFKGFLAYCLAPAVDEHKEVQAYLKGRRQLVLLDDVNVGLMIEHSGGEKEILIRGPGASHKRFWEIHQEIRQVQYVPASPGRGMPAWFRSALLLTWPLSGMIKAVLGTLMRRDPAGFVTTSGTTILSSVGMFGKSYSSWGISTPPHSLSLLAGGFNWKPAMVEGRIEPHEILHLTVVLDRDVVDAPRQPALTAAWWI